MNILKGNITPLTLFTVIAFLFACAESPKKMEESAAEETTETVDEVETMDQEDDASFMLPSPIQIAAMFNRAGLDFESGLTNPTENLTKYNTKTSKYLNFGVYSADLAYAVLNNQQQMSIDYLNAVKTLSDEIGMPNVFGSGSLIESFEKNIDNQDTVLTILTTIKRRTDEYLVENADESKESIFFSAAWLEGMYLGSNSSSDRSKLTPRLVEQMTILDNIIKAIKVQKDATIDMNFMVDGLTDLKNTFDQLESIKSLDMSDMDIDEVNLTEEELGILNEKITVLRTKIING
ncbi:MAG: hypothetical protein CMO34_02075 [Verrucomicrobia bacterium]|nr:hypothetical protein [Verrucomicrobiota bacterium]